MIKIITIIKERGKIDKDFPRVLIWLLDIRLSVISIFADVLGTVQYRMEKMTKYQKYIRDRLNYDIEDGKSAVKRRGDLPLNQTPEIVY